MRRVPADFLRFTAFRSLPGRLRALPLVLLAILLGAAAPALAADEFKVYFIDVEGGQSTLLVSPGGDSLLIDTGFDGYGGRDATRIEDAMHDGGVKELDYVLITHFHGDHVGGITNLLKQVKAKNFVDHGPSIESGDYPDAWKTAFATGNHIVVKPGDKIPLKGMDVTVVGAAGENITQAQAEAIGAGQPNPYCEGLSAGEVGTGENPQSVGIVARFGEFRFVDLGDFTWDREMSILCPNNKIGEVDLYLTTHHGANSPPAIYGMHPQVAVQNNGPRKGGNAQGWRTLSKSPDLQDIWQLHFQMDNGDTNTSDALIANLDEVGKGNFIKVTAEKDGSFTVKNPRNDYEKKYAAR